MIADRDGVPTIVGVGHMLYGAAGSGGEYNRTDVHAEFIQKYVDETSR
ncbi:MAG TPA: hypothetical protein VM925_05530 [Labilithrix sp.]|nr:hypothetical protein [Labilithrix sp.]